MAEEKNNEIKIEDTEFGPFFIFVNRINDDSTLLEINDVHEEINERFFKWFDLEYEKNDIRDSWKLGTYDFLARLRVQHKNSIATIYSKKGAIIID